MTDEREVPASVTAITGAWLEDALRSTGRLNGGIRDISIEVIGAGVGLMGELGRVHLHYEGDESLPVTMVAKCAAQNENRAVAQLLDFYNREADFYNRIGKTCPLKVPDSYYADVNQDTYDFILMMEDLGEVSPRDQLIGASREEIASAIEQVAAMHARWWGASSDSHPWMYDFMSEAEAVKLQTALYQPFVEAALENFSDLLSTGQKDICRRVGESYPAYWSRNLSAAETFIHGDYRQDNMLYRDNEPHALVMDWQISGRGRPMFDVAYFMCQSVQSDLRAEVEDEMLALYSGRLADAGVDYPLAQCREDYRRLVLGCLVYPMTVCGGLDLANERGRALAECMLVRNLQAIEDLGSADLVA